MTAEKIDFTVLDKFKFDISPVGIKYFSHIPDKLVRLDRKMTLCEMLKKAQEGNAFYADVQNHTCDAGSYVLGQTELKEQYINGEFGAGLGVFHDPGAASRIYQYIPAISKGRVHYIAFSPFDKLTFEPDVLLILANTGQAEILLRAMSYKSGKMWSSKYSSAIGCSWLFAYPYMEGEINFIATGLGFGMRRRKLFPEGMHFISIPFDVLPSLLQTLKEMPWVPAPYGSDGMEYVKKLRINLGLDSA